MTRFKLSPDAASDIRSIWSYIAKDNIRAARRVRLKIFEACRRIAEHPGIGHSRRDLTEKPVRFWAVDNYPIVYYAEGKPLEIVRVLHGARDIPAVFFG